MAMFVSRFNQSCGTELFSYAEVVEGNNKAITWQYPTVSHS